jgi:hypothetical protein
MGAGPLSGEGYEKRYVKLRGKEGKTQGRG